MLKISIRVVCINGKHPWLSTALFRRTCTNVRWHCINSIQILMSFHYCFQSPKKALHVSFNISPRHERSVIGDDDRRRSLLGYDWIAGMLDNTSYLSERPDDYFDDLKEFRRVNKDDCFGKTVTE